MKFTIIRRIIVFLLLFHSLGLFALNDKMEWWREARFGMFIHWGVYAVYGNVYDGLDINGEEVHYDQRGRGMPSEWIQYAVKIPRAVYREAAKEFDAKDYDPKQWVQIAKNAGMKYIVITAKHHDGFCLFETNYTDWNAIDASAAKRDLLKDLVKEAHAAGLKIGFYYSQNIDWMAEGGMGLVPELNGGEYPLDKVETYVNNQVIPQIKELTTNYDIDVFWFDYPSVNNSNATISQRILDALLKSPVGNKVIYNNRLFKGFPGDFSTPENDTPNIPYNGYADNRDWEACSSLNGSWGFEFTSRSAWYITWGAKWKTDLYTISRILELASKGGNFLLNVGPDQHGNIPEGAVRTLEEVGKWMKIYGETVYGTVKNELIYPFEYGYVTQKNETDGTVRWYLHVSSVYWDEKEIVLPGVLDLPRSTVLFETKEPLGMKLKDNNLIISLPDNCPNPYYSTIALHFAKKPKQILKSAVKNNQIRLTPFQAVTDLVKKDLAPYVLKAWMYTNAEISYNVFLDAGEYTLEAEYSAWQQDGEISLKLDDKVYTLEYKNTGTKNIPNDMDNYVTDNFDNIHLFIPASKVYSIKIKKNNERPDVTSWMNIRRFTLKKIPGSGIREIQIYPTFIKKEGYFVCESPNEQIIRIYDCMGRLRKRITVGNYTVIDTSDLATGPYIVKGDKFVQRIVVQ